MSNEQPPSASPPTPGPTGASPRRAASTATRNAARATPLQAPPAPKRAAAERLKEGAADTVLNSISILGEVIEDFRTSDRFFKYKALTLALWFLLSVSAFAVACPNAGAANVINAHLVVSGNAADPIYMVTNESKSDWQGVEILVNGAYRSTMSTMAQQGGNATLSPAVLFGRDGARAPSTLRITDIVVTVQKPEASVVLLEGGQPR